MSTIDKKYNNLCRNILANGSEKGDRTGTGTISVFGRTLRHDLSESFPILTTKSVHFKSVVGEILWFLKGDTNIKFLQDHKIKIWDAWATPDGEVGALYGHQWRHWRDSYDATKSIDQIANLIHTLKTNPDSRRMLVSAWNVSDLPLEKYSPQKNARWGRMALATCHYNFQCYVNDGKLSLIFNMRSSDVFLGLPFNLASYALLCHMLAQVCGLEVGELIWSGADVHIYKNHIEQVKTQIERYDNGEVFKAPTLVLNKDITDIDDFTFDDIQLINYKNAGKLTGEVAV